METTQLKKSHEKCEKIIDGIEHFERMCNIRDEFIEAYSNDFPSVAKKYENDRDTYRRAIARLKAMYKKEVALAIMDEQPCDARQDAELVKKLFTYL